MEEEYENRKGSCCGLDGKKYFWQKRQRYCFLEKSYNLSALSPGSHCNIL